MENEKLKVIAEGMGWADVRIVKLMGLDTVLGVPPDCTYSEEFTGDASQCMEIMEKLFLTGDYKMDGNYFNERFYIVHKPTSRCFKSETINEAVCNAAFEYFKELK